MTKNYFISLFALIFCLPLSGQEFIAVAQSSSDIVILLDPTDGSIVNNNFIDLTVLNAGTPKDICQVGSELWIADQLRDRIDIFDLQGNYLSTIDSSIGLDNIRGLSLVNGEVWVCNDGTNNGAPGSTIIRLGTDGTLIGNFPISDSPFDVVDTGTEAIVSTSTTDEIYRVDYNGNVLSTITTTVDFPQQLQFKSVTNSILVAGFSSPSGVYEFEINAGSQLNYYNTGAGGHRGVIELDNGNLLVSSSGGIFSFNTSTNNLTNIISGSSQYFERVDLSGLSIDENTLTSFSLYPNPAENFINISSNSNIDDIIISNTLGQIVGKYVINSEHAKIDLSSLNSGIYIVIVWSGNQKQIKKFIKK